MGVSRTDLSVRIALVLAISLIAMVLVVGPARAIPASAIPHGIVTTIAGAGDSSGNPALGARIHISDADIDDSGNLYLASNAKVYKVDHLTGLLSVVAGTGVSGSTGDGGLATQAQISQDIRIALHTSGDLYISQYNHYTVRRVDAGTGIITTVAGSTFGYGGDGGIATSGQMKYPKGIDLDASGNLYIADSGNHRVRMVDTGGTITTVAGDGDNAHDGDGGAATAASVAYPQGVAIHSNGDLHIATGSADVVRKVYGSSGNITSITMGGDADDVALDSAGNLYVADHNGYVRKVNTSMGISVYAGTGVSQHSGDGGLATAAAISYPWRVASSTGGRVLIVEIGNIGALRSIDPGTGIITTVAGYGVDDGQPASSTRLYDPNDTDADAAGNLYIADRSDHRIRRIDATTGIITTFAGTGRSGFAGDGGQAADALLSQPRSVVVGPGGDVYISDSNGTRIRRVDHATGIITTIAGDGTYSCTGTGGSATSATVTGVLDMEFDSGGNLIFVETDCDLIRMINGTGTVLLVAGTGTHGHTGDAGLATGADIAYPQALAIDDQDRVFFSEEDPYYVRMIDAGGTISTIAGTGTWEVTGDGGSASTAGVGAIHGMAIDPAGNLLLAETDHEAIRRIDGFGRIDTIAGDGDQDDMESGDGGPAVDASFDSPEALVLLDGDLVVQTERRVRKIDYEICRKNWATEVGTGGNDTLSGTADNDVIIGFGGGDTIIGSAGIDLICAGTGQDTLDFSGATAGIIADLEAGTVTGYGSTTVSGVEHLVGSDYDDTITGDEKGNRLWGGAGNDVLAGGPGNDRLYGEDGRDRLLGGDGKDQIYGGDRTDNIKGGRNPDYIEGEGGNDTLNGQNGDDTIFGNTGNDTLIGWKGDDTLNGGKGTDTADGGDGTDTCRAETQIDCEP